MRATENMHVGPLPAEHQFLHRFGLDVEVMTVDGADARVFHHLHDGEQVSGRIAALRDVGRAGMPEVEECPLLPFQFVAEQAGGDLDQPRPLLADVNVVFAGVGVEVDGRAPRIRRANREQVFDEFFR